MQKDIHNTFTFRISPVFKPGSLIKNKRVLLKNNYSIQFFYTAILLIFCSVGHGQFDTSIIVTKGLTNSVPFVDFSKINDRYKALGEKIGDCEFKVLKQWKRQSAFLEKKIIQRDTVVGSVIMNRSGFAYQDLLSKLKKPIDNIGNNKVNSYIPGLDSLGTLLHFLQKSGEKYGLTVVQAAQIKNLMTTLSSLQDKMERANDVKKFMNAQQQMLKETLDKFGIGEKMKSLNKQAFYYQQQINEYKSIINNPEKAVCLLLGVFRNNPVYRDFINRNGQIADLFGTVGVSGSNPVLPGLQTRANLTQQTGSLSGGGGIDPSQYVQQQITQAQTALQNLKDNVNQYGGGSSDIVMPGFTPNQQKTKSFLKRLELGLNVASQKANTLLPATSDIALTLGYKLSDKSVIGTGIGYKLGWGSGLRNIRLSSQGMNLRSFMDIKLKGSVWVTGGYEMNYLSEFSKLDQLKNINAWQESGLIGCTKKYKIGKKEGKLQLLWDFLSYRQRPQPAALKFRIGYNF